MDRLEDRRLLSAVLTTLASLDYAQGDSPQATLTADAAGNLYGTATYGGAYGEGTVFEIPAGTKTIQTLASFSAPEGEYAPYPLSKLVVDASGNLYGTALETGPEHDGSVFEVAAGSGVVTTLARFDGTDNGAAPEGDIVRDAAGDIFGTTDNGGANGQGTVYEVVANSGVATTIYSFDDNDTGSGDSPVGGLVADASGNLYGTAEYGGGYAGTIFKLAAGTHSFTVLASNSYSTGYDFNGGLTFDSAGNLFGTAEYGGEYGYGAVYELPAGASTLIDVASFDGTQGRNPYSDVLRDAAGNLFGTTQTDAAGDAGTVFEIPAGTGTVTTLTSFPKQAQNDNPPSGGITADSAGNLYGARSDSGYGSVYQIVDTGYVPSTVVLNLGPTSQAAPFGAPHQLSLGSFTDSVPAGPYAVDVGWGDGTADTKFSVASAGVLPSQSHTYTASGVYQATVTVTDANGHVSNTGTIFVSSAGVPAQLVFVTSPAAAIGGQPAYQPVQVDVEDSAGTVVTTDSSTVSLSVGSGPAGAAVSGTTSVQAFGGVATFPGLVYSPGGTYSLRATDGTLPADFSSSFTVEPTSTATLTTLATFSQNTGTDPSTALVRDSAGNLYGTTTDGQVFEVAAGTGQVTDLDYVGYGSSSKLIIDAAGDLFGACEYNGATGDGYLFEITAGSHALTVLASFDGTNGDNPSGDLARDSVGNLYGVTYGGGTDGYGTIFELAAGSGTITDLYSFDGQTGQNPAGGVALDAAGNLYGTIPGYYGDDDGSVFELPAGSSSPVTLHTFAGPDGANPAGGLVFDSSGDLFGVTYAGGGEDDGTVFEISAVRAFTSLASFDGDDGSSPNSDLLVDGAGTVFGVAEYDGANSGGEVYKVVVNSGVGTILPLASLDYPSFDPLTDGGLVADSSGTLYGTTAGGGINQDGTVFELTGSGFVPGGTTGTGTISIVAPPNQSATVGTSQVFNLGGFVATNTTGPYTVSVNWGDGTVATTITQPSAGTITGQPHTYTLAGGTDTVTVKVTDAAGDTSSATFSVTVTFPVAAKLVVAPVSNASAGAVLSPIYVDVETASGALDPYGTYSVTLSIAYGPAGSTIGGTLTAGTVGGVATFSNVFLTAAGTYRLAADEGFNSLAEGISPKFVVSPATGPALVPLAPISGGGYADGIARDAAGDIFGTNYSYGQYGDGYIFELPAGANAITILASFDHADGYGPSGDIYLDPLGNLYGSTLTGGSTNGGVVWELPAGTNTISTIATFPTAATAPGGITADAAGDLFGATFNGGIGDGSLFEIPAGTGTIVTLATFNGTTSGGQPNGVIRDAAGDFFGQTDYGGAYGDGTVFEVKAGSGMATTLANFTAADGGPVGNLVIDSAGDLYGSTQISANNSNAGLYEVVAGSGAVTLLTDSGHVAVTADAAGNIFAITQSGTVYETAPGSTVVTTVGTARGGFYSQLVNDSAGNLYGGASSSSGYSVGELIDTGFVAGSIALTPPASPTVAAKASTTFSLGGFTETNATGPYTISVNWGDGTAATTSTVTSFGNIPAGSHVYTTAGTDTATVVVTSANGVSASETFVVTVQNALAAYLASFDGPDGIFPTAGLIRDAKGDLFGTTFSGGAYNNGTVFEIPAGTTAINVLVNFNSTNGANPQSSLLFDSSGNVYGTTASGGAFGRGTVFELMPNASGSTATMTTLATFNSSTGYGPIGDIAGDSAGDIFGDTFGGGAFASGTVFEVVSGSGTVTTLASLNSSSTGKSPYGGVTRDAAGNLYGTTSAGGVDGDGTIFELPAGGGTLTTLVSFNGTDGDGGYGGLLLDSSGNLFGSTVGGGFYNSGTVFELTAAGTFNTRASFPQSGPIGPVGDLVEDAAGNIFGESEYGSANSGGADFEVAAGSGQSTILYSFPVAKAGTYGYPYTNFSGVIADSFGNLYGVTGGGGLYGDGGVFEVSNSGFYATALKTVTVGTGETYHFPAGANTSPTVTTLPGLTVAGGGKAVVDPASSSNGRQLLEVTGSGLSLAGSTGNWIATLDLGNNDLDLPGASLSVVTSQTAEGYGLGTWNGPGGIVSSTAAANSTHLTAIGVIQNNQSGSPLFTAANPFDGVTPGAGDVLAKYTYVGDANLDGKIDGSDYSLVDNGYAHHLTGWYNGDFNYDGVIDGSDYALIDNAFNNQNSPIGGTPSALVAAVAAGIPAKAVAASQTTERGGTRAAKIKPALVSGRVSAFSPSDWRSGGASSQASANPSGQGNWADELVGPDQTADDSKKRQKRIEVADVQDD